MKSVVAPEQRPRFALALLIGAILIPAALGSSATIFNDGDVSWHIATGQWMLDHRAIPHTDPFSFTWAGRPWVPFEWLAEVLLAASYRLAGYSGVAALVTAAMMTLHAIIFFNATRFIRPLFAVGALVAMDAVLIPMMLARPHVLAWPLLGFWTWLMLRARKQDRAPLQAGGRLRARRIPGSGVAPPPTKAKKPSGDAARLPGPGRSDPNRGRRRGAGERPSQVSARFRVGTG